MAELIETRWKGFGLDRVYVQTPDGEGVGYVDLASLTTVVQSPEHEAELRSCLARWAADPAP